MEREDIRAFLKAEILARAYKDPRALHLTALGPDGTPLAWFFDFRPLLFDKHFLKAVVSEFWLRAPSQNIQVGGLESASLPLVAACVLTGDNVTGFYIRKSRKKKMEMKQIEGDVTDAPIVLVDDLMNSGSSFKKQIEILEKEGKHVTAVFSIVRFRTDDEYAYFSEKGIQIISIFSLEELNIPFLEPAHAPLPLSVRWYKAPERPHFFEVRERPQPILTNGRIYVGLDNGFVKCFDAKTGKEMWRRKVAFFPNQAHMTFVDPLLSSGRLYYGTARGVLAVLDSESGHLSKMRSVADRIVTGIVETSPSTIALAARSKPQSYEVSVFDAVTLEKIWSAPLSVASPTSILYVEQKGVLLVGNEIGKVQAFDAKTGKERWSHSFDKGSIGKLTSGEGGKYVLFGTGHGSFFALDSVSGKEIWTLAVGEGLAAAPLVSEGRAYLAGLDGKVYCIDTSKHSLIWKQETKGRIFASPMLLTGMIYVGNNEGKLYTFDPDTGMSRGSFMVTERITSRVMELGGALYVFTFAEEIYCLGSSVG